MDSRFEYTFVRLKLKSHLFSGDFGTDHHEVIRRHAVEGWRFVQAYAPAIAGYGAARQVDLIFERPLR